MHPKNRIVAQIARDNAEQAWKIFMEEGHTREDYAFCERVIESCIDLFNATREIEDDLLNDT